MRQEKLVCVNCPKGCNITVQIEGDEVKDVQGYSCKEGLNYARREVIRHMRSLTSTEAMDEIKTSKVSAPIAVNQVLVADFLGTGVNLVSSRTMQKA